MAKTIKRNEMQKLMRQLYPKDNFDVAVNKAKKDYYITVLNRQSNSKKYLVNDNLV